VLAAVFLKRSSSVKEENTTWLEAYAISLRGQSDRQETLVQRFERQGIRVIFFDAVDTREDRWRAYTGYLTEKGLLTLTKTVKTRVRLDHSELTPGAVGCFLSHLALWEKLIGTDRVHLVLEDDSMPISSFGKELRTILEHFPRDADIFLMSHQSTNTVPVAHLPYPCSVLSRESSFFLMNCYLISPSGIRKILRYFHHVKKSRFEEQVDSFLSAMVREGVLRIYVSDKQLCPQDNSFPTTIQGFRVV
jgi:glycosyl transferase family 25